MKMTSKSWFIFLAPRYWGGWLLIGFMRLLALLPFRAGLSVATALGFIAYWLIPRRRKVAEVNCRLCFPELSEQQLTGFVKKVMEANAMGIIETAWAYWAKPEKFTDKTTVKGLELMIAAQQHNRGVILLGAHFTTLDLGGLLFSKLKIPIHTMYRPHDNPLMDNWIYKKRNKYSQPVDRKNFRKVLRLLKDNGTLWYAPDQDFGIKGAVYAPFFHHPAATIVATSKLVKLNNSPILMFAHYRNPDNSGYTIEFSEVKGFPTGDEAQDAAIVNYTIEQAIRKHPEQYMWVHKRFKTQADGNQKLYKAAGC